MPTRTTMTSADAIEKAISWLQDAEVSAKTRDDAVFIAIAWALIAQAVRN